ncbi:GNAT family N-acetyltransferase [Pseudomonas putida]|uniref:GNAT family N-acetyltransferase n=1 Tax=Pseudomonas putida TaxID=303 RepID=UPI0008195EAD|nr:GNAT family N-acetyltransferase [Pseudomonas putida]OCT25293.1 GCN5 family acetyltransferase [Pseudomonas putida]OCT26672.1 GCN5 family acetyltransferase [Pseudomonas putida]OCT32648.1 GCN5 family acetyltransferase [Pseudomonas putida]OCT40668.1 GCN5 family acetyltransferase [Pseudomonas putida]
MTPTLRQALPEDIELLFDIRTSVKQNHLSREQMHDLGITATSLTEAIREAPCTWIAEYEQEAVGFTMVDLGEGELFALFVRPQHEGKGIGRLLLQKAEAALFERHEVIHLTTDGDQAIRANGFYQRAGWVSSGAVDDRDVRYEKRCTTPPAGSGQ